MPAQIPELTEAEVVRIIHAHIEGLFPKTCTRCGQTFANYREYLRNTQPVGFPVSYDLEAGDAKPAESMGNLSMSNCRCGNTLALSSQGMPMKQLWAVLKWIEHETERRGVPMHQILGHLRDEVSKRGLA